MGRWAECLSQTRNFAKARFSEIEDIRYSALFCCRAWFGRVDINNFEYALLAEKESECAL
jgi:hypothetical protein